MIWVKVRARITGDAHITRGLRMGKPKTRGCPYHCDIGTMFDVCERLVSPGPCFWHHSLRSWRDCVPVLSWRRSHLGKAAKPPWKISPDTLPMSFECRNNDDFHPTLFSIIVFNIKSCSFSVVKNKQTRPLFLVLEKFITCLPPEKPSDIAFILSVLNRVQRLWAS